MAMQMAAAPPAATPERNRFTPSMQQQLSSPVQQQTQSQDPSLMALYFEREEKLRCPP
jgi:hypothetical protein